MGGNVIRAIQTHYDGYFFRSRQEARFAVWLNALDIQYHYELEGFDMDGIYYLPDFYLPDLALWVEIKGKEPTPAEFDKAAILSRLQGDPVHITWANFDERTRHDTLTFWHNDDGVCHSASGMWFDFEGVEAANVAARSARFERST